jgi:hypothetical protein
MRLSFDYRSLADGIEPAKLSAHQQAIERLEDALSFVITADLASPDAPEDGWVASWESVAAGGLALMAVAGLAAAVGTLAMRRRRRRRSSG